MSADIGVIIGRFQVHELHLAHVELIKSVTKRHKKVIVLLGVTSVLNTRNNPLDYTARQVMIQQTFPDVYVAPLADLRTDEAWTKLVDSTIRTIAPIGSVCLYGGRDSFIKHYKGSFETKELETRIMVSGTEARKNISQEVMKCHEFRRGAIYAAYNRYPTSFQTVDVAPIIYNSADGSIDILVGRKTGEIGYRFVGGFVDPRDSSLEGAATRELREETSIYVGVNALDYIGSYRIDDWRYRSEQDKIMTAFYVAKVNDHCASPSDDISEVRWVKYIGTYISPFDELIIVPEHKPLYEDLKVKLHEYTVHFSQRLVQV